MGLNFVVTQTLIRPKESRFASTPDARIDDGERKDGKERKEHNEECKGALKVDAYIRLWKCKTPEQVKKDTPSYYYQVLHQMLVADSLVGYLSVYHPHFRAGQLNIVQFKKINLIEDFKLLNQRCQEALCIFEETRDEMLNS